MNVSVSQRLPEQVGFSSLNHTAAAFLESVRLLPLEKPFVDQMTAFDSRATFLAAVGFDSAWAAGEAALARIYVSPAR